MSADLYSVPILKFYEYPTSYILDIYVLTPQNCVLLQLNLLSLTNWEFKLLILDIYVDLRQ